MRSREMDLMMFMGPSQLEIIYDSIFASFFFYASATG